MNLLCYPYPLSSVTALVGWKSSSWWKQEVVGSLFANIRTVNIGFDWTISIESMEEKWWASKVSYSDLWKRASNWCQLCESRSSSLVRLSIPAFVSVMLNTWEVWEQHTKHKCRTETNMLLLRWCEFWHRFIMFHYKLLKWQMWKSADP
jgi:hypothetical protein